MTKQSFCNVFVLPLPLLFCLAGCDQRKSADRTAATDSVFDEVMGKPSPLITVPNTSTNSVPDASPNLESSLVKQFADGEFERTATNGTESAKPVGETADGNTVPTGKIVPKVVPKLTTDDPARSWIGTLVLPRETWEVQYLGNNPVGHFFRRTTLMEGGDLRHEADSKMRVSIKGEAFDQHVQLTTLERDNGELISIDGAMELGPDKQTFTAKFQKEMMNLSGEENGKAFNVSIPWEKKFRGPFAVEQSMFRKPLQPRETRKLKYFDPLLRKLIDGILEASDYSSTPTMLGGSRELLEVRNIGIVGESGSQALLWVDKKGEGLKSYIPANDILSFRTEPIVAQIVASTSELRNLDLVSIPLTGDIDRLSKNLKSMSFEVKHKTEDPYRLFADRIGQRIFSTDALTASVTVYRGGREADYRGGRVSDLFQDANELKKEDRDALSSTIYIPTDNTRILKSARDIVALDKTISPETATNFQKAKACRRVIQKYLSPKEFDKRIGLYHVVVKAKQANCIESALFFAAHCRALEIPTRIAMGVKYNRSVDKPSMNFHAWVEVRDGNRWLPLDSSEDLSGVSSTQEATTSIDRFKIKETSFNSPNPYIEILNVLRLLPELSVKVLSEEKPQ